MPSRNSKIAVAVIGAAGVVLAALISTILQPSWWRSESRPTHNMLIAGTVVEESTNQGIGQAKISIVGRPESYVTEDNGNFRIELHRAAPEDTAVRLHVVKKGYVPYDEASTATKNLVIQLARVPTANLDVRPTHSTTEATAARRESETPATNIPAERLPGSNLANPPIISSAYPESVYPQIRFNGTLGFTTTIQRVTFHGDRAFRIPAGICWSLWCYKNSYLYISRSRVAFDCRENDGFSFDVPRARVADVLPDLELRIVRNEKPEKYEFLIVWEDEEGNRDYRKGDWKPAANFASLSLNDFAAAEKKFDEIAAHNETSIGVRAPTNGTDSTHVAQVVQNGLRFETINCLRSGQSVDCTALITNTAGKNQTLCQDGQKSYFVDNDGNIYPEHNPGSSKTSCIELASNVPIRGIASARNVDANAHSLTYFYVYQVDGGSWSHLVFRNMTIIQK